MDRSYMHCFSYEWYSAWSWLYDHMKKIAFGLKNDKNNC